jgi:hypothetical protein
MEAGSNKEGDTRKTVPTQKGKLKTKGRGFCLRTHKGVPQGDLTPLTRKGVSMSMSQEQIMDSKY